MGLRAAYIAIALLCATAQCEGEVGLSVGPSLDVRCGQNFTLQCNISSSRPLMVLHMEWVGPSNRMLCAANRTTVTHETPGVTCSHTPQRQLALTLARAMPEHQGVYFCKIRSTLTQHIPKTTTVRLQECYTGCRREVLGGPERLRCSFHGVYPKDVVHWLHGTTNVTTDSTNLVTEDDGVFNISSILNTKDSAENYQCFLVKHNKTCTSSAKRKLSAKSGLSCSVSVISMLLMLTLTLTLTLW